MNYTVGVWVDGGVVKVGGWGVREGVSQPFFVH